MNRRHLIFISSFVVAFAFCRGVMDKDTSATVLQCVLGVILASIMSAVVTSFLPLELLPQVQDKAILVTGCDSGFGNHLAARLDSLGVTVYAGCLFPESPGVKKLKKMSSERLHILRLDVTQDKEIAAAVEYVKKSLNNKVLWGVVNNAGIASFGEIEWINMEDIHKVMDVNFYGQLRVTKAFLPLLRESKGRIVNTNSIASRAYLPCLIPYCSSKHAASAFTEGLRIEMKKFSISVHSIEPWFYSTPILNILDSAVSWNECSTDIKKAYGDNYFNDVQDRIRRSILRFAKPSSKVYLVVDCMVNACIGKHPQDVYSPSLFGRLITAFVYHFPMNIQNGIIDNLMYAPSLPLPGLNVFSQ